MFKSFNPKKISRSRDYFYPKGRYSFGQRAKHNECAEICATCGYTYGNHFGERCPNPKNGDIIQNRKYTPKNKKND